MISRLTIFLLISLLSCFGYSSNTLSNNSNIDIQQENIKYDYALLFVQNIKMGEFSLNLLKVELENKKESNSAFVVHSKKFIPHLKAEDYNQIVAKIYAKHLSETTLRFLSQESGKPLIQKYYAFSFELLINKTPFTEKVFKDYFSSNELAAIEIFANHESFKQLESNTAEINQEIYLASRKYTSSKENGASKFSITANHKQCGDGISFGYIWDRYQHPLQEIYRYQICKPYWSSLTAPNDYSGVIYELDNKEFLDNPLWEYLDFKEGKYFLSDKKTDFQTLEYTSALYYDQPTLYGSIINRANEYTLHDARSNFLMFQCRLFTQENGRLDYFAACLVPLILNDDSLIDPIVKIYAQIAFDTMLPEYDLMHMYHHFFDEVNEKLERVGLEKLPHPSILPASPTIKLKVGDNIQFNSKNKVKNFKVLSEKEINGEIWFETDYFGTTVFLKNGISGTWGFWYYPEDGLSIEEFYKDKYLTFPLVDIGDEVISTFSTTHKVTTGFECNKKHCVDVRYYHMEDMVMYYQETFVVGEGIIYFKESDYETDELTHFVRNGYLF